MKPKLQLLPKGQCVFITYLAANQCKQPILKVLRLCRFQPIHPNMSLNHSPLGGVNPLKIDEIADI